MDSESQALAQSSSLSWPVPGVAWPAAAVGAPRGMVRWAPTHTLLVGLVWLGQPDSESLTCLQRQSGEAVTQLPTRKLKNELIKRDALSHPSLSLCCSFSCSFASDGDDSDSEGMLAPGPS